MDDLIRRRDALAFQDVVEPMICKSPITGDVFSATKDTDLVEYLSAIPAVDAVEVRRGWWLFEEYPDEYYSSKCSLCGFETVEAAYLKGWNFCPNCGAQMEVQDG